LAISAGACLLVSPSLSQQAPAPGAPGQGAAEAAQKRSYDQISPLLQGKESFQAVAAKDKADKAAVMGRQQSLLEQRYDLTPRPDGKVTMTRGKPIQVGPAARLPEGMTWDQLAGMSSDEIRDKGLFPKGFLPLPHVKHEAGGMVFPQAEI